MMPTTNRIADAKEFEIRHGCERFVFRYPDTPRGRYLAKRTAQRWADDRLLSFTVFNSDQIARMVG